MPILTLEEIKSFSYDTLREAGVSELQAETASQELMDAEAEGIRNVGLGYLPHYLNHLRCGKLVGDAIPEVLKQSASAIVVNANFGFCHTAYLHAEESLISMTKEQGIGMMAIHNSYSAGVLGWFVRRLAERELVSLMFANSSKAVAAYGGKVPFFGTNPLAYGSPRKDLGPVVVDMATASTARVNIVQAANEGREIEPGHAIDPEGNPTTDPALALKGAQLPVGGPKGFGLGLIVDLMGGALTGSNCSYEAPLFANNEGGPPNVGQSIIAFNPEFFSSNYIEHLESMFTEMTHDNDVRIPGARRHELREKYEKEGIEVPQVLIDRIKAISKGEA